jgi:hypothetical protein
MCHQIKLNAVIPSQKKDVVLSRRSRVVFFHVHDVTHTLHSLGNAHAHTHMPNAIHLLFNVVAYCTIILDIDAGNYYSP